MSRQLFFDHSTGSQDSVLQKFEEYLDTLDLSSNTISYLLQQWEGVKTTIDEVVDQAYDKGYDSGKEASND